MSFILELIDLGQNYLIKSRTPKKNKAFGQVQFGFNVPNSCGALKKIKKTLINTVQGLLLTANGLDLGYWVQS